MIDHGNDPDYIHHLAQSFKHAFRYNIAPVVKALISAGVCVNIERDGGYRYGAVTSLTKWAEETYVGQLVINDDAASMSELLSSHGIKIDVYYKMELIHGLSFLKRPPVNATMEALVRSTFPVNFKEEPHYLEMLNCLAKIKAHGVLIEALDTMTDWDNLSLNLYAPVLMRNFIKHNALLAVKKMITSTRPGWWHSAVHPHEVAASSYQMIDLLLDHGWNPFKARAPKIIEKLISVVEAVGDLERARVLRARLDKIVANKVKREIMK